MDVLSRLSRWQRPYKWLIFQVVNLNIKSRRRSAQGRKKKSNSLFGFFYRYWLSIVLILVLSSLIRQNFIVNNFPVDIAQKQNILRQNSTENQDLTQKNQQLKLELNSKSDQKLEILESMARYKFGLIKSGEKYYQINNPD